MSEADLLPPFVDAVFSGDGEETDLLGSRCPHCGAHQFPGTALCPADLTETEPANLGRTGRLYSYTVVRAKPPFGLPAPYAIGYVDLDGCGLRVFALLDAERSDALKMDMPLRLISGPLGVDLAGQPCRRPYFTPADTVS